MSGFRKPKQIQAFLKIALYGPAGSGKTFTSLLVAEGLAATSGKRVALVDTEAGSSFYGIEVKERSVHPDAFDFDVLYTRSLTETLAATKELDTDKYGVIILDSITHIWEAAIGSYAGRTTSAGTIPFHAWGKIKKPYKDLMALLLSLPAHVLICGRQKNIYGEDEDGELKMLGVTLKAEAETPYEPHILIRMEAVRNVKTKTAVVTAFAEKDRTGVLAGKTMEWPTFDSIAGPILPLLGVEQAHVPTGDETSAKDAEALEDAEVAKATASEETLRRFSAKFELAETTKDVDGISKEITPAIKKTMLPAHVKELRERFQDAHNRVKGKTAKRSNATATADDMEVA